MLKRAALKLYRNLLVLDAIILIMVLLTFVRYNQITLHQHQKSADRFLKVNQSYSEKCDVIHAEAIKISGQLNKSLVTHERAVEELLAAAGDRCDVASDDVINK